MFTKVRLFSSVVIGLSLLMSLYLYFSEGPYVNYVLPFRSWYLLLFLVLLLVKWKYSRFSILMICLVGIVGIVGESPNAPGLSVNIFTKYIVEGLNITNRFVTSVIYSLPMLIYFMLGVSILSKNGKEFYSSSK